MKIVIGADHAGFELKEKIKTFLAARGDDVVDVGTDSADSVDYPDYGKKVAEGVSSGLFERGVVVCGSGIGMAITANKLSGVRAAVANDEESARLGRLHNDVNVLSVGARLTSPETAEKIVSVWLSTDFEGGRHQRRLDKINDIESENC